MKDASKPGFAIVVEPHHPLALTVADCLRQRGFDVAVAGTHVGGATLAASHERVDFLVAAVPAPGEDHAGAYLAEARETSPNLPVVVMLSDPKENVSDAPRAAVKIVKPFSVLALAAAIERALARS